MPETVFKIQAQPEKPGRHTFAVQPQSPSPLQHVALPQLRPTFRAARSQIFRQSTVEPQSPVADLQHVVNSSQYDNKIRFASPKTTVGFTPKREKAAEPPKKRRRISRYPRDTSTPIFSVRTPVETEVTTDAWALIFKRCDVKFLKVARLVCKSFNEILKKDSIWRMARQASYPDTPGCPQGITEMQYSNLLSERGCQVRSCTRDKTRKVYWPFMLRMCGDCCSLRIQAAEHTSEAAIAYAELYQQQQNNEKLDIPTSLAGLLPSGTMWSGRYSGPRQLNEDEQTWKFGEGNFCVLSTEYDKLKQEFDEKRDSADFNFVDWAKHKWDCTRDRMMVARVLDMPSEGPAQQAQIRMVKIAFFRQKASELDPPMRFEVLDTMAAYHSAIDTTNKASLRSWDLLQSKICSPEVRTAAESLLKWEKRLSGGRWSILNDEEDVWERLAKHRDGRFDRPKKYKKEQKVVIDCAKRELQYLTGTVHDEDILLLLLDNVRRAYEALDKKPVGLNGDGTEGIYQLTLDDARMVIHDVLMDEISGGTIRAKAVLGSLRCIACWRPDCNKSYEFEELLRHIRNTHCKHVGINLHYWKLAAPHQTGKSRYDYRYDVAWYHIPWPKSFPALPGHRKALPGMYWNPDEAADHMLHPDETDSAFENFIVCDDPGIDAKDTIANFSEAIRILAETRLEAPPMIKIALEYASQRLMRVPGACNGSTAMPMTVANLQEQEIPICRIVPALKFKFMCGICMSDPKSSYHVRHTRYPIPLDKLVDHWKHRHDVTSESSIHGLLHLPSNGKLLQIMEEEDAKLKVEKSKSMKAGAPNWEASHGHIDPRVQALFEVPSSMSRFTQLFLPKERELYSTLTPPPIETAEVEPTHWC